MTLGTAMAGDFYPFVISFPSTTPAPPTISPTRSHRNQPPPPQQQGLPPRRNTEDYMFTGVLDAASAAAGACSPSGNGGGDDPSSSSDRRQQQHVVLGTAAAAAGDGGGGGNSPSGPMTTASSSTVTSPYVQWPLPSNTTASNASSSSRMMVRGSSGWKRSDSMGSSSTGGGAVWQRKTLHLACDTKDETLQWARCVAGGNLKGRTQVFCGILLCFRTKAIYGQYLRSSSSPAPLSPPLHQPTRVCGGCVARVTHTSLGRLKCRDQNRSMARNSCFI